MIFILKIDSSNLQFLLSSPSLYNIRRDDPIHESEHNMSFAVNNELILSEWFKSDVNAIISDSWFCYSRVKSFR